MASARQVRDEGSKPIVVVGVSLLAWMFDKSEEWASGVLRRWQEEQDAGGPVRVFTQGRRGSRSTTMAIVRAELPPGRDPALYAKKKGG